MKVAPCILAVLLVTLQGALAKPPTDHVTHGGHLLAKRSILDLLPLMSKVSGQCVSTFLACKDDPAAIALFSAGKYCEVVTGGKPICSETVSCSPWRLQR